MEEGQKVAGDPVDAHDVDGETFLKVVPVNSKYESLSDLLVFFLQSFCIFHVVLVSPGRQRRSGQNSVTCLHGFDTVWSILGNTSAVDQYIKTFALELGLDLWYDFFD